MRATVIESFGPPDALALVERPLPAPGPGEQLIEVLAAGINPSDVKNAAGMMPHTKPPRVPGRDFAGVVAAGPSKGSAVFGCGGELGFSRDGSHATHLLVPDGVAIPVPPGLSFAEAACIGVNFVTAAAGLEAAQLRDGERLTVVALGAVGSAAAQIGRHWGASVIGVARGAPAPGSAAGAALDLFAPLIEGDVAGAILRATEGHGADVVFDTVGGVLFESALEGVASQGRLIEIAATAERRVSFDLLGFYRKQKRIFGIDSLQQSGLACARLLTVLSHGFAGKSLTPHPIAEIIDLDEVRAAYVRVAAGKAGKVVLAPFGAARALERV